MQRGGISWFGRVFFALCIVMPVVLISRGNPDVLWHAKELRASLEMERIVEALNAYYVEYGVMPAGDHAQIIEALQRKNPRDISFLEGRRDHVSVHGEWLDPWGTPYHIGFTGSGYAWSYSFGPNKADEGGTLGSDDIVSWR